jgi:hypothetical protein
VSLPDVGLGTLPAVPPAVTAAAKTFPDIHASNSNWDERRFSLKRACYQLLCRLAGCPKAGVPPAPLAYMLLDLRSFDVTSAVGAQKIYDRANSREHAVARGKHSLNLAQRC